MSGRDIVVIGFSAGGIDPLLQLVATLPHDPSAARFAVHDLPAQSSTVLPGVLNAAEPPRASYAVEGGGPVRLAAGQAPAGSTARAGPASIAGARPA